MNINPAVSVPVVSVCMVTYKHEAYLSQAIEGVLMQECHFPVELVIADDCSPDTTAEIVRGYQQNHPKGGCINYLHREKNIGMMPNFNQALTVCRGKYIALCEGDDYWTDPHKLQKQVDFLERNPEFAAYGHNVQIIGTETRPFGRKPSRRLSAENFMKHRPFHTASLIINMNVVGPFQIPPQILSGDRAMFLYISAMGDVYYDQQIMAVYRKNEGGISNRVSFDEMKKDLDMIPWIKAHSKNFPAFKLQEFIMRLLIFNPVNFRRRDIIHMYLKYITCMLQNGHVDVWEWLSMGKRVYIKLSSR